MPGAEQFEALITEMTLNTTFLGAAGGVTGSRFLVESGRTRLLVDCGLFQERENLSHNWETLAVSPASVDAVLLTHAHVDHSGWLPVLVRQGFKGPVYCTAPTADIARLLLEDSGRIQEEDAEIKRLRHKREKRRGPYPEAPLYTLAYAQAVSRLFSPVSYGAPIRVAGRVTAEFRDAGHILGSATIRLSTEADGKTHSIRFSGDLGNPSRPLIHDPAAQAGADAVVVECTYGDRSHLHYDVAERLAAVINQTVSAGGDIVIPAFAVERAQELLYHLGRLVRSGKIRPLPVFIDSPLATSVTALFAKYPEVLDADIANEILAGRDPFDFPGLRFVRSGQESEGIDRMRGSKVIIAGSGMATGGRIKRHLVNNIGRSESTVLFVGYQARNTLGRQIIDGEKPVRIYGASHPVRARIERIDGFSAHADREGLVKWLEALRPAPKQVFLVHGEPEAAESLAGLLRQRNGWDVTVPEYGSSHAVK